MNRKIKIFYVIDLIFMLISIIGIIILDNKATYGLSALTNVGYVVVLIFIFVVSLILLITVSIMYVILKKKRKQSCE